MWPFKRNKKAKTAEGTVLQCTFCGSQKTVLHNYHGSDQPDPVRVWRGKRYLTCTCQDCGREFYIDEPSGGLPSNIATDEDMIDEEALQSAEDALKRQTDEENDHMFH